VFFRISDTPTEPPDVEPAVVSGLAAAAVVDAAFLASLPHAASDVMATQPKMLARSARFGRGRCIGFPLRKCNVALLTTLTWQPYVVSDNVVKSCVHGLWIRVDSRRAVDTSVRPMIERYYG
jgi:hypothetical protein